MTHAAKTLLTTLIAASAVAMARPSTRPSLIWNASPSVPLGLYRVAPTPHPARTDLVVVRPPARLASFLAERGYLPRGVPLLKHVGAVGKSRICRVRATVSIDGVPVAGALARDRGGRPLPAWAGCIVLAPNQVFLLNPDRADSLDGRYFGPLERSTIIGRAEPVWTDGER